MSNPDNSNQCRLVTFCLPTSWYKSISSFGTFSVCETPWITILRCSPLHNTYYHLSSLQWQFAYHNCLSLRTNALYFKLSLLVGFCLVSLVVFGITLLLVSIFILFSFLVFCYVVITTPKSQWLSTLFT